MKRWLRAFLAGAATAFAFGELLRPQPVLYTVARPRGGGWEVLSVGSKADMEAQWRILHRHAGVACVVMRHDVVQRSNAAVELPKLSVPRQMMYPEGEG